MKIFENAFPSYEDFQILGILFSSYITPHTTLCNEYCLKFLLGVCNIEERCDLSISLISTIFFTAINAMMDTNVFSTNLPMLSKVTSIRALRYAAAHPSETT
jgi:hypothetical protein